MDPKKNIKRALIILCIGGVLLFALRTLEKLIAPPKIFPTPYQITIDKGQTLFSISKELYEDGAIQSRRAFEMIVLTFGNESKINEGQYYFEKPVSVIEIGLRIIGKEFGVEKKRVTFPEGFSNKEMASRLTSTFEGFDTNTFMKLAKEKEGYLFPDTYGFFPDVKPELVIQALSSNFEKKIAPLRNDIKKSSRSEEEVVIMASIIEKEANGENDRALIAGILWNRIDAGIPLQVDAPFLYLLGKESRELTKKDLAIISPYNTYKNKGLPPSPINNPGLAAIKAAIYPQKSSYFYYLHDKEGNIHYASTFAEHTKNIRKFLQ